MRDMKIQRIISTMVVDRMLGWKRPFCLSQKASLASSATLPSSQNIDSSVSSEEMETVSDLAGALRESGSSAPLSLATFLRSLRALVVLFLSRSQRGDSGTQNHRGRGSPHSRADNS